MANRREIICEIICSKLVDQTLNKINKEKNVARYFCIFGLIDLKINARKKVDRKGKYMRKKTRGP